MLLAHGRLLMTPTEFKQIRISNKLSQKQLGEIIYMSARQIRRIENGSPISPRIEMEMNKLNETNLAATSVQHREQHEH